MTDYTPLYQLPYLAPLQPMAHTRRVMEEQSKRIEKVLSDRGVPPTAGDISALRADVTALQQKTTVVPATTAAMPYQKSQVDALLANAASVDELTAATVIPDLTANWWLIFVAQFPLRVASVSLMTQTAIASSATNSYVAAARRMRAGTAVTFASKTTNSGDGAGGQAIAAYTDWNLDNVAWTGANAIFQKGDALLLGWAINAGAPTPTSLPRVNVTARYVPL